MKLTLARAGLFALLIFASGAGLAKKPGPDALKDYQSLVEVSDSPLYESTADAISRSSVTPLQVNPGFSPTRWPLTEKQPRLRFGNSISNFLLFSVSFDAGESYELMVQSLCYPVCAGARSSAVKPKILLLGPDGNAITDSATKVVGLHGVMILEITGKALTAGNYFLLVAADNSDPGQPIVVTDLAVGNLSATRLTMTSYPFGKIVAFAKRNAVRASAAAGSRLTPSEELMQQSEEMARLSEEINRRSALFSERPKRRFITAAVQQPEYRAYLDEWKKKIERIGNEHYPEEAVRDGLSGRVIATVSIGRNGELLGTEIAKSSGSSVLDNAVVEISKLASPFSPIPSTDDIDILSITRTWDFRNGQAVNPPQGTQ